MTGFPITRRGFIGSALSMAGVAPAALGAATQADANEPIKLGFNGDLSASPSAQSGRAAVAGIRAAIEDIEKSGGILNRPVALAVRDDLSQPPKSIQNMSDLIDNEKVVAVLGPTNSGNALAWKQMPNQKQIPVLGCIASATDITKPMSENADNYMFRVGSVDRFQVVAIVAYAKKNPNAKQIGLLSETTGYGQGGLKDLLDICKSQSIVPAANEKFGVNDTDMTSQLAKMRDANVDTVLLWAQGTPIGQVMRSMDKIGYFPLVLTCWAADNLSFFNTAGPALAEKPIFLRTLSQTLSPRQQRFFDRIRARLDADSAFSFAAQAYDAAMLLAKAITQAGTTNGSAIRSALENLTDPYEGYTKTFQRPFSRDNHEGLAPSDQHWTCWRHGELAAYRDAVTSSLAAEDFKG